MGVRKLYMKVVSSVISIHSSDTAGVCSSLYELGGMTVVHDASGCNSTYTTHDEPRWYGHASSTFISALTEADAILGNDERFIDNVAEAAKSLESCRFIAICGSPLPMMVGTDFAALGAEIERRSGIPVLALNTNGINSYLAGVNQALCAFAERFCRDTLAKSKRKVNILGATPLDFSVNGQVEDMKKLLEENGFEVNSCWSMGSCFEELQNAGAASVNLLVSSSAKDLAGYFEKRFNTPFVACVPIGKVMTQKCLAALERAISSGISEAPCVTERTSGTSCAVIGETIWSSSLVCALQYERHIDCHVINPLEERFAFLKEGEKSVVDEYGVEEAFSQLTALWGDPLYKPVVPAQCRFVSVPHEAFSGRCFRKEMRSLCGQKFEKGI